MSVPLRKDDDFVDEDLTTADLAQGKRPAAAGNLLRDEGLKDERGKENRLNDQRTKEDRPGPVLTQRSAGEGAQVGSGISSHEGGPPEVKSTDAHKAGDKVRDAGDTAPLFPNNELEELRNRWSGVQTAFVDEPRRAVEQADGLVASTMKRLAEVFAEERSKLEHQWDRGDNVSTEDLRIALQRYRSFFQRLLSI
jgi:hypothetical protein